MTLNWKQWLIAQCHREDSVGLLARFWLEESRANRVPDCEAWMDVLSCDPKWEAAVLTAKSEFAASMEYLKEGKSSPTFRRLFASPAIEKVLKESSTHHRQHPDVSAEIYLRGKHVTLLKELEERTLIYLDTCHWIISPCFDEERECIP